MPTINIPSHKTYFMTRFFSTPGNGVLTYSCPSFFNVAGGDEHYSGGIGKLLTLYAEENTSSVARTGVLSITGTTDTTTGYEGNAVIVCSWTINQEAAPAPPVTYCEFDFNYNSSAFITNNTDNRIEFQRLSSGSYNMVLPSATIGTGFEGEVTPLSSEYIRLTDKTTASETFSNEDNMEVELRYEFEGMREYNQEVSLRVTYTCGTDEQTFTFLEHEGYDHKLDLEDWFMPGETVNVNVSFEFIVNTEQ